MAANMTKAECAVVAKAAGLEPWQVCVSCGKADKDVEGGGLWYCPNPRCGGCAGGQRRHVQDCTACKKRGDVHTVIELLEPCIVFQTNHASLDDAAPRREPEAE